LLHWSSSRTSVGLRSQPERTADSGVGASAQQRQPHHTPVASQRRKLQGHRRCPARRLRRPIGAGPLRTVRSSALTSTAGMPGAAAAVAVARAPAGRPPAGPGWRPGRSARGRRSHRPPRPRPAPGPAAAGRAPGRPGRPARGTGVREQAHVDPAVQVSQSGTTPTRSALRLGEEQLRAEVVAHPLPHRGVIRRIPVLRPRLGRQPHTPRPHRLL
jgi:hypothetical protein